MAHLTMGQELKERILTGQAPIKRKGKNSFLKYDRMVVCLEKKAIGFHFYAGELHIGSYEVKLSRYEGSSLTLEFLEGEHTLRLV